VRRAAPVREIRYLFTKVGLRPVAAVTALHERPLYGDE
jgi:hypothetical protein